MKIINMNLERIVAWKLGLMRSLVFKALAWVLALRVPHKKGFGEFKHRSDGGSQAGAQCYTSDEYKITPVQRSD